MSLKRIMAMAMAASALTAGATENLVKNGDGEDAAQMKKWHKSLTQNTTDKHGGNASFEAKAPDTWAYGPMVEIDPGKEYLLSGWFKSVGPDKSRVYLGLQSFDAKNRAIARPNVIPVKDTETTLMEDAAKGATVLKVADAAKWLPAKTRTQAAFDAKADFSDLPNFKLSPVVKAIEKKDAGWEVTLATPMAFAATKGTAIRQHYSTGGFQYSAASYKETPQEWTQYSAKLKGLAKSGAPDKQFWPGTKKIRPVVIANYNAKNLKTQPVVLFDDIVIEEVK